MIADLLRHAANQLHSRTLTTASRWASQYIELGQPFAGPLRYTHHPWMREMLDAEADACVGQKAAQLGYSTLTVAITLKTIADGRNALYLLPTRTPDASDFSITRFDKIIDSSDYLSTLFTKNKNVGVKRAASGTIYIRGMNSNSALKSVDVSLIIFDEVDEMPPEKIPLAQQRLSGQLIKKSWYISTPTVPDYGINAKLKESTESHFFFECPACSRQIELNYPDNFELRGESHTDPECDNSYLKCNECQNKLPHETKSDWLATGHFVPSRVASILGFYVNQLYSATVSPAEFARAVLRAEIDLAAEQELWNSMLGVPKLLQGARIEFDDIKSCYGQYSMFDLPPRNRLITIGIDVGKLLHYCVDTWAFDRPCADLNLAATNKTLRVGTLTSFSEIKNLITEFAPAQIVIDSEPESRKALELAAMYPGLVRLCKFVRSEVDNTITGDIILKINRTAWLDTVLSRYKTRRTTVPLDLPPDYMSHIQALVRRYVRKADSEVSSQYLSTGVDHYTFARLYSEVAFPVAVARQHNRDIRELV